MFGISCERFTSRLRRRLFECVVRQDIPWFELTYVSTGALTCLLSKDSALVQAMSGCKGSSLLHGVLGVIFSVAIVINIDPKLGLLTALFILVILAAIVFCMKVTYDVDIKVKLQDVVLTMNPSVSCNRQENGCYTKITKLAVDAITNIRTVAMTCSETSFLTLIHQELQHLYSYSLKKMHWR